MREKRVQEKKGKRIGMQTDESEWCLSVDGLTVAKHTAEQETHGTKRHDNTT